MIITIESGGRRSLFQLAQNASHKKIREAVMAALEPGSYTLFEGVAAELEPGDEGQQQRGWGDDGCQQEAPR